MRTYLIVTGAVILSTAISLVVSLGMINKAMTDHYKLFAACMDRQEINGEEITLSLDTCTIEQNYGNGYLK